MKVENGQRKRIPGLEETNQKLAARVIQQAMEIDRLKQLETELLEALERTLPLVTAAARKEAKGHAIWRNTELVEISSKHREVYKIVTAAVKKAKQAMGNANA